MDPIVTVLIVTFIIAVLLAGGGAVVRQFQRLRRRRSVPEEIPLLFGPRGDNRPPIRVRTPGQDLFADLEEEVRRERSPGPGTPTHPVERSLPGTVVATEAPYTAEKYIAASENGTRSRERSPSLPIGPRSHVPPQIFTFDDEPVEEGQAPPGSPRSNGRGKGAGIPPARNPVGKEAILAPIGNGLPPIDDIEVFEGRALRFHRPDARTMRLLPGRLEVEKGEDSHSEIRFVHHDGPRAAVTFGREPGEPLLHIQLRSPTVSRRHARMAWNGEGWVITNLSETNPIILNGVVLDEALKEYPLKDGDRIEMGEVVFRYRR